MNPKLTIDVIKFELARSLTLGRSSLWLILVLFPIGIVSALRLNQVPTDSVERWGVTLYYLIPEVITLLGLLLWATPVISTEVESQTWVYLAMRRSGRFDVLLGKYFTAVTWTLTAAILSTTVCTVLMGEAGGLRLWLVMIALSGLSSLVHASLYVLIGTVFYRRTMVSAVFYTLVVEYGLSFVPAVANKFTINYRLRGLLSNWMDWNLARSEAESVFGSEATLTHLAVLFLMTTIFFGISLVRISHSEFPTQQEG